MPSSPQAKTQGQRLMLSLYRPSPRLTELTETHNHPSQSRASILVVPGDTSEEFTFGSLSNRTFTGPTPILAIAKVFLSSFFRLRPWAVDDFGRTGIDDQLLKSP